MTKNGGRYTISPTLLGASPPLTPGRCGPCTLLHMSLFPPGTPQQKEATSVNCKQVSKGTELILQSVLIANDRRVRSYLVQRLQVCTVHPEPNFQFRPGAVVEHVRTREWNVRERRRGIRG